ncbi:MAG: dihydroorotate dehydrogenase, partial [Candidatus Hydrothermarchaeales archaeon]
KLCGMNLENPTILASGILGVVGSTMKKVAKNGAGAVVTKSIGTMAREGHKNPSVIEIENGVLNAIGLANPGYKEFEDEVKKAKEGNVPVIGSIYGFNIRDFVEVAKGMEGYGVDALELNLSCPNVTKAGAYYGQNKDLAFEAVKAVKESVKIPVIAKLTSNVSDIVSIAKACEEAKCDAITAINTVRAMKIDINVKMPIMANKFGGLSGPCIKPIAIGSVYDIAKETDMPVIGCGGITTGEDVIEFMMAGASAVQIGTAVLHRGISDFMKVTQEIEDFMDRNGYNNVGELVGAAQ